VREPERKIYKIEAVGRIKLKWIVGWGHVAWTHLAEDGAWWWTIMNFIE
jgi:hypothetical protein